MVCPSWFSFILYNPIRLAFTDRNKITSECGVNPTSIVLEVGSGNGFVTEILAERAGKVYALELQEGMIKKLRKRVHRFGNKVEIIHSDIAAYEVQKPFADVCIMYYSFHEVSRKPESARNIAKAVRVNGLLSIYEPTIEVTEKGMRETINLFISVGFVKEVKWSKLFTNIVTRLI